MSADPVALSAHRGWRHNGSTLLVGDADDDVALREDPRALLATVTEHRDASDPLIRIC